MSDIIITKEGKERLDQELKDRKIKRRQIADKIETAKELGDLSENAEYHEAKDEQGMNESRIAEIEDILNNAIIADNNGSSDTVGLGSTVVVKFNGLEKEFTIVGFNEADPLNGKISNESPLGQAFLNKKKGDEVEAKVPAGIVKYTILEVK